MGPSHRATRRVLPPNQLQHQHQHQHQWRSRHWLKSSLRSAHRLPRGHQQYRHLCRHRRRRSPPHHRQLCRRPLCRRRPHRQPELWPQLFPLLPRRPKCRRGRPASGVLELTPLPAPSRRVRLLHPLRLCRCRHHRPTRHHLLLPAPPPMATPPRRRTATPPLAAQCSWRNRRTSGQRSGWWRSNLATPRRSPPPSPCEKIPARLSHPCRRPCPPRAARLLRPQWRWRSSVSTRQTGTRTPWRTS